MKPIFATRKFSTPISQVRILAALTSPVPSWKRSILRIHFSNRNVLEQHIAADVPLITGNHGRKRLQTGEAGSSTEPVADAEHVGTDGRAEKGAEVGY